MLSCDYQAIPTPNLIMWSHNGTALMDSDSDITIVSDSTRTMLTRSNLPADGGGEYTCNATNVAGSGSDDIFVRVQCKCIFGMQNVSMHAIMHLV